MVEGTESAPRNTIAGDTRMSEEQGVIRRISWRDLFPWLILFRTFRIAISPPLLALATLAVIVTPLGWGVAELLFHPPRTIRSAGEMLSSSPDLFRSTRESLAKMRRDALEQLDKLERPLPPLPKTAPTPAPIPAPATEPVEPDESRVKWRERIPRSNNSQLAKSAPLGPREYLPVADTALFEAYFDLAEPLARLFQLRMTLREAAYYLLGMLWTLAVWALPGGFVTRRAIVQLATQSPTDVRETAEFAIRRYLWYFLTPLYPLVILVLLAVPVWVLGLIVWLAPGLGSVLAGLVWILVAILGLGAMWLLGGLILGWPLMWPTISAERDGDPFEAFSRSYAYVYGKPLHYFFYIVVAAAFGALCWAVVEVAARLVQEFGFWALSWGSGGANAARIRELALIFAAGGSLPENSGLLGFGATLIGLIVALIHSASTAFRFTYFFTVASAIYLLLRQDVDEKELDEVFLETEAATAQTVSPASPASVASAAPPPAEEEE
jgi:hypothetical protein